MVKPLFALVPTEQVRDAHRIETAGEFLDRPPVSILVVDQEPSVSCGRSRVL